MTRRLLLTLLAVWPLGVAAETLYVIDRLIISLRSDLTETATVVKSVETGTALEVLEHDGNRVRVREPQGAEGWVDTKYLSTQPPRHTQVAELQDEIKRLRAEAARAAAPKNEAAPRIAQLETQLTQANATLAQVQTELTQTQSALAEARQASKDTPKNTPPAKAAEHGWSTLLWLVIAFAMLGVGFLAGIIWVRESIRRRSGGMYLRI